MDRHRGNLVARVAQTADQVAAAMALRQDRFGVGADPFDAGAQLMLIAADGVAQCSFRLTVYDNGRALGRSYAGQFYDLAAMAEMDRPLVELGRFCLRAGAEPDVLRLAFAMMAKVVDDHGAAMLFGCASFAGAAGAHDASLRVLCDHLAPIQIGRKSPYIYEFKQLNGPVTALGMRQLPPLLRSYLALGGWVSDHAVQDFDLDTIHVLTALPIAAIPAARAAALRELAAQI